MPDLVFRSPRRASRPTRRSSPLPLPASLSAAATLAALTFSASVLAQPGAGTRPDPADPAAAVPSAAYSSSLGRYRRHAEQPVRSWREANETVNRIGGWRAYAREATAPEAPRAASPAPAASSPSSPAAPASPASPTAAAAPAAPAAPAASRPAAHGGAKH